MTDHIPTKPTAISEEERFKERIRRAKARLLEPPSGIPRRDQSKGSPLSFAQQRLWFLHQLHPEQAVYNRPLALALKGRLSIPALEHALNQIVIRHEVLRSVYPEVDGQPIQRMLPELALHPDFLNIEHLDGEHRKLELDRLVVRESQRPFELARGPLIRALLIRLSSEEHVLLLVLHHIVFDAWSAGVLIREFGEFYESAAGGTSPSCPELPIQYADYALWETGRLRGDTLEGHRRYWKQQLSGGIPALQLPMDRPRPRMSSFRGAVRPLELTHELCGSIRALCRREGVTPFMTLLSAFLVLLHRFTEEDDIAVGSPVAQRSSAGTEALIGLFINTLVFRGDLSGDPSFVQFLKQMRKVCLDAYAHQDMPFENLVQELHPERNADSSPFFNVLFNLETTGPTIIQSPSMTIEELSIETGVVPFDLVLEISEKQGILCCHFAYNTDLFEISTIRRLSDGYLTLLEGIAADPSKRTSRLPVITPDDRNTLLVQWNDAGLEYPDRDLIHHLFESQAALTPNAVAAQCGRTQITYGELNRQANQIANHLRSRGVCREMILGLCLTRSLEMIKAVLGILKTGAAYLPMDPAYPPERLAFMVQDSRMPLLVTESHLRPLLPSGPEIVCVDADRTDIARVPRENPERECVSPGDLACIIYTSGSTGKPKGVMLEHRGLMSLLTWIGKSLTREQTAGVLAATSLCFDLSLFELFVPLSSGGTVILAESVLDLSTLLGSSAVTLMLRRCQ
jgi:non-ribosomal peptide synthetase component F